MIVVCFYGFQCNSSAVCESLKGFFLWFTDCLTIGIIHETMVVHMTWVWTFFNNYSNHPRMSVLSTLCGNVDKHSPFDIYIYIYIHISCKCIKTRCLCKHLSQYFQLMSSRCGSMWMWCGCGTYASKSLVKPLGVKTVKCVVWLIHLYTDTLNGCLLGEVSKLNYG